MKVRMIARERGRERELKILGKVKGSKLSPLESARSVDLHLCG